MRKNMKKKKFCIVKVTEERSRIRIGIHFSEVWIRGSGSAPKCHESTTLPDLLNPVLGSRKKHCFFQHFLHNRKIVKRKVPITVFFFHLFSPQLEVPTFYRYCREATRNSDRFITGQLALRSKPLIPEKKDASFDSPAWTEFVYTDQAKLYSELWL